MADDKASMVWQQTSNYSWWQRSNDGADDINNKTTEQQRTNVRRQRLRTTTAGERQQMNINGTADNQQRSIAEDKGGCLDRTTGED